MPTIGFMPERSHSTPGWNPWPKGWVGVGRGATGGAAAVVGAAAAGAVAGASGGGILRNRAFFYSGSLSYSAWHRS
jgi:hypothetical protein